MSRERRRAVPPRIAVPSSATPDPALADADRAAPTPRHVMAPPPASVMGGTRPDPCCAEQMAATAARARLADPHTPWQRDARAEPAAASRDMGLLGASPSMMPPPACGINALTSLPPLDPSQPAQLGRLLASLIMPCLCSWGQHRTTADWPPELLAFGPLPALHDALITSHLLADAAAACHRTQGAGRLLQPRKGDRHAQPQGLRPLLPPVPPAFWPHAARPPARRR